MACNPPKFADLGKDAKDLLNKNFHFGLVKLEGKTKSLGGAELNLNANQNVEADIVNGDLEIKHVHELFTIKEKITSDPTLNTNIAFDKLCQGLKADLDVKLWPASGKKGVRLNSSYKHEWFNSTHDVDITTGPTIHASAVTGYNGFLLGGSCAYDAASSQLKTNQINLAYHGKDFQVHTGVIDLSKYTASIYHKVNGGLAVATSLAWSNSNSSPTLALGVQKQMCGGAALKVKLDNNLQMGVSYIRKLADGVQVTLSGLVNAKNINAGGHRAGLAFNFTS